MLIASFQSHVTCYKFLAPVTKSQTIYTKTTQFPSLICGMINNDWVYGFWIFEIEGWLKCYKPTNELAGQIVMTIEESIFDKSVWINGTSTIVTKIQTELNTSCDQGNAKGYKLDLIEPCNSTWSQLLIRLHV